MQVDTFIREQEAMHTAGKRLLAELQDAGGIGSEALKEGRIPGHLQRLDRAGRALNETMLSTDPKALADAQREWNKALKKTKEYTAKLANREGRFSEHIQRIEKELGFKKRKPLDMDKMLNTYVQNRQRYFADRIVRTESLAAGRAQQWDQFRKDPTVVAVIWRMAGTHMFYAKRVAAPKGGAHRGRRCVCEQLNNRQFPPEAVRDYPRMGHPFCNCHWDPVYSSQV
jgi:hypothetical protein